MAQKISVTKLKIQNCPDEQSAETNCLFLNPSSKMSYISNICMIDNAYYKIDFHNEISVGYISMHGNQRNFHSKQINDEIIIKFVTTPLLRANLISLIVDIKNHSIFNVNKFVLEFREKIREKPLNLNQQFRLRFEDKAMQIMVGSIDDNKNTYCLFDPVKTNISIIDQKTGNALIGTSDNDIYSSNESSLFKTNINLSDLGIGGLDEEFRIMFRKAFASRAIPRKTIEKMGIRHTKGILLYGPPGTGKTLIARKIGEILNCKEPKIVSGPELLNKYVGSSEENVRKLFEDAFKDKDEDYLHLIICDEFDALCKQRGSVRDGTGVGDNIVNQFLTMIDGPKQLNNILLICMTNRKDLIDPAILRAGRLEVHIEINLPNESGRLQILDIHTRNMKLNNFLSSNVDLKFIASLTKNYTGAELATLVKNASDFAITREISIEDNQIDVKKEVIPIICQNDFIFAIDDMQPMFGKASDEICEINKNPFIFWSHNLFDYSHEIISKISSLKCGNISMMLIHGPQYIGKTKFVAYVTKQTAISCVRIISPEKMLRVYDKSTYIYDNFTQCTKTNASVLILDGFERIIEWISLGSRFNNNILQTILSIFTYQIKSDKKLTIFVTANDINVLESLEILPYFDSIYNYPNNISKNDITKLEPTYNISELTYDQIDVAQIFKLAKYK